MPLKQPDSRFLRAVLQDLQAAGVQQLPVLPHSDISTDRITTPQEAATSTPSAPLLPATPSPKAQLFNMDETASSAVTSEVQPHDADSLEILQQAVSACTLCQELAETRTQTVFCDGNPQARLVFLGEAPGADEDRQGVPFVGRAGKLLTDIIQNGMKLSRSDVYIMNVLKCRPPGNRNPLPHEAANCRPYLLRQLELVSPEFICCLGAVAAQNLLQTTEAIGRMRGRFYDFRGIRVMCTYHPAYLLRNPSMKAKTWEDIQLLMRAMGLPTQ